MYPADWKALKVTGFVDADGEPVGDLPVSGALETRALGYDYDRLYPFPVFNVPEFKLASRNRFFLCIEARDPNFDRDANWKFLESLTPVGVYQVER